jgi:hypothetical protein
MASNEASLLATLSQSHDVEYFPFSCHSPKNIIACSVPTPILQSRAFSSRDFLLDCFVSDNSGAPPFHAVEIPLLLVLSGSLRDLLYASVDVEINAVGGRIRWRVKGGFLIGQGQTLLSPNLTPYLEAEDFFLQHHI